MRKLLPRPADERLNRTLKMLCAVLIVYTASGLILELAAIPSYYQRLTARSVPVVRLGSEITMSNAIVAAAAEARGMTVEGARAGAGNGLNCQTATYIATQ